MIPLSSRCCCVSSITTAFSWVDWFWHWRRKHKREVLKLLRGQILCGRHDAERIDFGFIRGRSLSLQRAMAWVDPSRNTSEDQCTGSNGGPKTALDARRQRIIISESQVNLVKWVCLFMQALCALV